MKIFTGISPDKWQRLALARENSSHIKSHFLLAFKRDEEEKAMKKKEKREKNNNYGNSQFPFRPSIYCFVRLI